MGETLAEVKERLSQKYLGQAGIHGVGLSHKQQAVRVYLKPDADSDQQTLLQKIAQEAAPYTVLTVQEEPPAITSKVTK